jgi:hypothetical protein
MVRALVSACTERGQAHSSAPDSLHNEARALHVDHFDQAVRFDERAVGRHIDQDPAEQRLACRPQRGGGLSGLADRDRKRLVTLGAISKMAAFP